MTTFRTSSVVVSRNGNLYTRQNLFIYFDKNRKEIMFRPVHCTRLDIKRTYIRFTFFCRKKQQFMTKNTKLKFDRLFFF